MDFFCLFKNKNKNQKKPENELCIAEKGKKTRGRVLRNLIQQVTKNIEKGIDNKADNRISDKGEALQQILENWETEDLPAVPSSNMKS